MYARIAKAIRYDGWKMVTFAAICATYGLFAVLPHIFAIAGKGGAIAAMYAWAAAWTWAVAATHASCARARVKDTRTAWGIDLWNAATARPTFAERLRGLYGKPDSPLQPPAGEPATFQLVPDVAMTDDEYKNRSLSRILDAMPAVTTSDFKVRPLDSALADGRALHERLADHLAAGTFSFTTPAGEPFEVPEWDERERGERWSQSDLTQIAEVTGDAAVLRDAYQPNRIYGAGIPSNPDDPPGRLIGVAKLKEPVTLKDDDTEFVIVVDDAGRVTEVRAEAGGLVEPVEILAEVDDRATALLVSLIGHPFKDDYIEDVRALAQDMLDLYRELGEEPETVLGFPVEHLQRIHVDADWDALGESPGDPK